MDRADTDQASLILVVDDDEILRDFARMSLEEAGYAVVEAENGQAALDIARRQHPQLVLMDVNMPAKDGLSATAELRQMPGFELLPVLILTANEDVGCIERAYAAGATDFMAKPVNWMLLVQRVRFLLRANESQEREKALLDQLQQAQKLEAIATLASGIAHDFNNLLQTMLMLTEMAKVKMQPGDNGYSELEQMLKVVAHGSELVGQIMGYARKGDSEAVAMHPNHEVKQAHQLLGRTLARNLRLHLDLEVGVAPIRFNPVQLEQVLFNLAINAKHAMPEGGDLTFRTRATVDGGKPVTVISVIDTGEGMDAHTVQKIFEPFFSTKGSGGTGLGLAMVRRLVEAQGGRVRCVSTPGAGTQFDLLLPVCQAQALTAA